MNRDEIDELRKNISDLDMDKELAIAKQNDILNRLKVIKQLKDDKEYYKSWILDSLIKDGFKEK